MLRSQHPERVFIAMGATFDAAGWTFYLAAIVWWTVDLGYGPLQLILLGTVLEVTVLVSEVPTGVVADRFSRKWSIVLSTMVLSLAFILTAATLNYGVMLVSQALFGLGWTLRSGADVAWLTDEMTALRGRDRPAGGAAVDDDQSPILLRRHRLGMIAGVTALIPTILFGAGALRQVIIISGISVGVIAVWLAFAMTDHFRLGRDEDEHPHTMREILREGYSTTRRVPSLRLLFIVMLLLGLGGDALDRLGFKQFIDEGGFGDDSLLFTGLLFIVMGLLGAMAVWAAELGLERGVRLITLALVLLVFSAAGAIIAALAPAIGIAIGLAMQDPCREAFHPVSLAWTNREAPEAARATVHSFISQAHGLGETFGGVALASLAEAAGIRWAIFVAGGLWAAASLLTYATQRQGIGAAA